VTHKLDGKSPYEYVQMLRNTARFRPDMAMLDDCADFIEYLADKLTKIDYYFENGQPFKSDYLKSIEKAHASGEL